MENPDAIRIAREDLDPYTEEDIPRLLYAGEEWSSQPYLWMTSESAELAAGEDSRPDKGIVVDKTFGTMISGPASLSAMPEEISMAGGYYRLNPMLLACIGSSAALPVPFLVHATPPILEEKKDLSRVGKVFGVGS